MKIPVIEDEILLAQSIKAVLQQKGFDVELSVLDSEELLPFEPLYFEQSILLDSQIEEGIRVSGSPRHLRQTLGILLDNAMKYSPQGIITDHGGKIWAESQAGQILFRVQLPLKR